MFKIVITGSIGMGKSTTAKMFAELGGSAWKLYDADAAVHQLYEKGGAAVEPIAHLFPEAIRDNAVNREILSQCVLGDPSKIKKLEAIVHPLVRKAQLDFIQSAQKEHARGVIFDIPLFFETGGDRTPMADYVIVASAPQQVQKARAFARPDMNEEKWHAILKRQMPDAEKRARADFIVETQFGLDYAKEQIATILKKITA